MFTTMVFDKKPVDDVYTICYAFSTYFIRMDSNQISIPQVVRLKFFVSNICRIDNTIFEGNIFPSCGYSSILLLTLFFDAIFNHISIRINFFAKFSGVTGLPIRLMCYRLHTLCIGSTAPVVIAEKKKILHANSFGSTCWIFKCEVRSSLEFFV